MTIADQPPHRFDGEAAKAPILLDVAGGIERLMGDRDLYQRMLRRYCGDYREGAAPIRRALASGDLPLAHRLAHNLKGAAGMIGATAVYRQAALLEAALRTACLPQSQLPDSPHLLVPLDHALAAVAGVIGPLLVHGAPHADLAKAPPRAARPAPALLLAQLEDFLDRGDGAALDLLEQADDSLKAALGEQGFDAIAGAAREFDFEAALAALKRARREMAER
jgi:HPt (histidine-containing phosphotransfer) domain-containing protein